jgi:hypothetical protein
MPSHFVRATLLVDQTSPVRRGRLGLRPDGRSTRTRAMKARALPTPAPRMDSGKSWPEQSLGTTARGSGWRWGGSVALELQKMGGARFWSDGFRWRAGQGRSREVTALCLRECIRDPNLRCMHSCMDHPVILIS